MRLVKLQWDYGGDERGDYGGDCDRAHTCQQVAFQPAILRDFVLRKSSIFQGHHLSTVNRI